MKISKITTSVFLLFFTAFVTLSAQQVLKIKHSCSFDGSETETEHYIDNPSKEANRIVEKIMRANVLPQNFIIKAANCKNALATSEGVNRYILYSTHFLENFKKEANTQWAAYSVLAHEIGHHLSNHNLGETDAKKRKIQELQADKFAGGVLLRLGATLDQAQAGIRTFSLESETTTHPNKNARLEAVAQGWKQAQELQNDNAPHPIVSKVENENANEKPKFTAVSDYVFTEKIVGKWTSEDAIHHVFDIFKDGNARLTTTFKVSNTTQVTPYKWSIKDGIFTRFKVFVNGSLGSAETFTLNFVNDKTLDMKMYNRYGQGFSWTKVQ